MSTNDDTGLLDEETFAERERLHTLLTALDPHQWDTESLCAGWRIREVLAHVTMPYRYSGPRVALGLVRAGLRFNRFADHAARKDTARLSDAQLVDSLGDNLRTPWHPPGGGAAGGLSHDVIHGLDMTVPLGMPGPPPHRIALVLEHAGAKNFAYFGTDLTKQRYVATDADIDLGVGEPVRLSAAEVLLTVTGRLRGDS